MSLERWLFRSLICALLVIPFSSVLALVVILVSFFSRRQGPTAIMRFWARLLLQMYGVRLEIHGMEHVSPGNPCIYMANHASMVDIPVIIAALPVDLRFIFKKSLLFIPFVGQAIYLMGMIPIDRSARAKARDSLRRAGQRIREGKHILIFPEGTRTRDGSLQSFKKGGFYLAQEESIDIQPLTVNHSQKICGRSSMLARKGTIEVIIHPRINTADFKKDRLKLMNEVRGIIESVLEKSDPATIEGRG